MSKFRKYYTVMEVKKLMEESEGRGPGKHGGHAMKEHGYNRADVTDRNKPKDSAFITGWALNYKKTSDHEDSVMSGVFDDYQAPPTITKKMTKSFDQFMAVCNALNSSKGQKKLGKLDGKPDKGNHEVAFQTDISIGSLVPQVRAGSGKKESTMSLNRMHIILYKLNGVLHIHTAYAV